MAVEKVAAENGVCRQTLHKHKQHADAIYFDAYSEGDGS